ncbi:MAG: endonuclease/exonuclease/phosphatase family protein [Lachnospiraceae bacterium]|nr:endonuclease/exonuclease/phosphatase family protein [Lachnospiraceae bacterium]
MIRKIKWKTQLTVYCVIFFVVINFYYLKYLLCAEKYEAQEDLGSNEILVMSYNIRCWTVLDVGKKGWFYRADLVIDNISLMEPDIIGFQEVTSGQYAYLKDNLPGYVGIISYRDLMPWSEGCPIFFNTSRYELIESQSFWLSDTPDKISKGWGAAEYRICSYVILLDKKTNIKLSVFNTHLDHKSEEARINGLKVIVNRMDQLEDMPTILLGDFNSTEDMEAYEYIADIFLDVKYEAKKSMSGNTYHNWGKQLKGLPIDYVLVSKDCFDIYEYIVLKKNYAGTYPSDHFPVCAKMKIKDI